MTQDQKNVINELIRISIDEGFNCRIPLAPIAEKYGIKEKMHDANTESGLLWEYGPYTSGMLDVCHDGEWASVDYDQHDLLANWSDFRKHSFV